MNSMLSSAIYYLRSVKRRMHQGLRKRRLRQRYANDLRSLTDTYIFFRENPHESMWGSITAEDERAIRNCVQLAESIGGPIVEVGSLFGHTTQFMATLKDTQTKLIAVENFSWNPFGLTAADHRLFMNRSLRYCIEHCNTEIFDGDSESFFREYRGPTPSMVFIDAGHSYQEVKADIRMARAIKIPIICGHDYHTLHPGVIKAVDEEFGDEKNVCGSVWAARDDG